MAHFATKRFDYWGQLGVLVACCAVGFIVGSFAGFIPLLGEIKRADLVNGNLVSIINGLMTPEHAGLLRWMQFISTLIVFFIPPLLYARFCHKKPFLHLGFKKNLDITQIAVVMLIMLASLPLVSALQELTQQLPWSKATLEQFKSAELAYNKQVAAIARMDNFWDYIISVIVIAFLPALFEETLFRGGIQNLLSRWFKMPILAIIITSIVFSAIHGSYLGFLSRFALGFVLGWIYYRTGNIWLNIIGHFFNNALAVTSLYFTTKPGQKIDLSKMDEHYPLWLGLASLAATYGLFRLFENISKKYVDRPGEEVLMPGYDTSNPFLTGTGNIGHTP